MNIFEKTSFFFSNLIIYFSNNVFWVFLDLKNSKECVFTDSTHFNRAFRVKLLKIDENPKIVAFARRCFDRGLSP